MDKEAHAALPPHKVRKLRKGTHSCQQCRRRKDKCVYDSANAKICAGCQSRGLDCRPQTTANTTGIEKNVSSSIMSHTVDPSAYAGLMNRLAKLEQLISDMASSGSPVTVGSDGPASSLSSSSLSSQSTTAFGTKVISTSPPPNSTSAASACGPDILYPSVAHNARTMTFASSGMVPFDATSVFKPHAPDNASSLLTETPISAQLYSLLPPEPASSTLIMNGPSMFLGPQGSSSQDAHIRPTDHPAIIAKRLMMLALCLQQLPSSFDMSSLVLSRDTSAGVVDIGATIRTWIHTVSTLVTCNDSLFSNLQGLETLILQGIVQGDSGQLRQAWMIGRKAINLAMLLGVHHDQPSPATLITSCIAGDIVTPQLIESLWFRANCVDRYASLVLGLPPVISDSSFALESRICNDKPEDRLSKVYAVCAGAIYERNVKLASGQDAQELTRSIEIKLESVAHLMDNAWWQAPSLCKTGNGLSDELLVMNLQVRHHTLTVLLHLPYMLQPFEIPQSHISFDHSRSCCMHACRAVVHRFLRFRRLCKSIITGRQIDYAALLSSMFLLQGHIARQQQQVMGYDDGNDESLQLEDVGLVNVARQTMEEMAASNDQDRLSFEAANSLRELSIYLQSLMEQPQNLFGVGPDSETTNSEGWHQRMSDETIASEDFSSVGLDPSLIFPVESFFEVTVD